MYAHTQTKFGSTKNSNNTFLPGQKPNQLVNKSLTDASTKRKELANNDQTKAESTHKQNLDQHKKANNATRQPINQQTNRTTNNKQKKTHARKNKNT